ncbi:uncharacterized protein LOC126668946 isoform X2 [Mercurialis annua]|uniref:uncharacterized protein LOC126668946 isoform X2 n=1 Tax=Mercurialis annua TaxID=3986 RepID=UPI00215E86B2|nr:uncharacterized protein LOC126668946 isoform X2 [Mercurialis annua]
MKQTAININSITTTSTMITSLPFDIAIKIALSLQVLDICALGSCSRFFRDICASDCLWEPLAKERWPSLSSGSSTMGWRVIYVRLHREMAYKAMVVVESVEHSSSSRDGSLEVGHYHKAIQDLTSMNLSFKDIQFFLFNPNLNVLLHLVGLHYCVTSLKVPAGDIMEALVSCKISERRVCVKWWKIATWFFGFHMREEPHSRRVRLADFMMDKGEDILRILEKGAVHEVFRVEICGLNATTTERSCRSS